MVSLKGATPSGARLARVVLSFSLRSQKKKMVLVLQPPGRRPWINPSRGRHRSDQSWAFAKRRGHDVARGGCHGLTGTVRQAMITGDQVVLAAFEVVLARPLTWLPSMKGFVRVSGASRAV